MLATISDNNATLWSYLRGRGDFTDGQLGAENLKAQKQPPNPPHRGLPPTEPHKHRGSRRFEKGRAETRDRPVQRGRSWRSPADTCLIPTVTNIYQTLMGIGDTSVFLQSFKTWLTRMIFKRIMWRRKKKGKKKKKTPKNWSRILPIMQRHRISSVISSLAFPMRLKEINNDLPEFHSVLKNAEGQGLLLLALSTGEILLPVASFPEVQSLDEGGLASGSSKPPELIRTCS